MEEDPEEAVGRRLRFQSMHSLDENAENEGAQEQSTAFNSLSEEEMMN